MGDDELSLIGPLFALGHASKSRLRATAGNINGRLPVTFGNFKKYCIDRQSIAPAIRECEALGFVEIYRTRVRRQCRIPFGGQVSPHIPGKRRKVNHAPRNRETDCLTLAAIRRRWLFSPEGAEGSPPQDPSEVCTTRASAWSADQDRAIHAT